MLPEIVQKLHDAGCSVIPAAPGEKRPIGAWKQYQENRPTLLELLSWQESQRPDSWGLVTGAVSERFVLDFDGPEGMATLERLGYEPDVLTPSGGAHVHVEHPGFPIPTWESSKAPAAFRSLLPATDVRGDGGFAIFHGPGREWHERPLLPWRALPGDLREILRAGGQRLEGGFEPSAEVRPATPTAGLAELFGGALAKSEGGRNGAMFTFACDARDAGISEKEMMAEAATLAHIVDTLVPTDSKGKRETYTEREMRASIRSAYNKPPRPPLANSKADSRRVTLRRASEVETRTPTWAWRGRISTGSLTILAGEQGLGKSTLLYFLSALITRGELEGDLYGHPADVLVVTLEDALETSAKPRLLAARADLDRVHFVGVETTDGDGVLTLPEDVAGVENLMHETGARFLAIDPIVATLNGKLDAHRDQDVRRALAPVAKMAERLDAAVLGVMHPRKGQAESLLARVGGSVAWTAAPRSVIAFGRDPQDPDEDSDRRVVVHAKSNEGPFAETIACRVEQKNGIDHGKPYSASRIVVTGTSSVTRADLVAGGNGGDSAIEEAQEFLRAELAEGARPTAEVLASARSAGIAPRTLKRARQALGVESRKTGGPGTPRELVLPDIFKGANADGTVMPGTVGPLSESPVFTADSGPSEVKGRQRNGVAPFADSDAENVVRDIRPSLRDRSA